MIIFYSTEDPTADSFTWTLQTQKCHFCCI